MNVKINCLCASVRKASRALTALYDSFLKSSGLRVTQYSLLINISRIEPTTSTELAERMLMDKTTLTRNLRLLVQNGLVSIMEGKDRRFKEISLTQKGVDSLAKARPLWEQAQVHVVSHLGKDRADQLIADLSSLADLGGNMTP